MVENSGPDLIDVQVGLALRRLRQDKGLSQASLGAAIGVTFQQIQKYERGKNRISASMMVRAAEVLGVSAAELLPQSDAPPPSRNLHLLAEVRGADELLEKFAAIKSPTQRQAVLRLVRSLAADPAAPDQTSCGANL